MSPRYIRNDPSPRESATAALVSGLVAAGVGVVLFYFVRLILARDVADASEVDASNR